MRRLAARYLLAVSFGGIITAGADRHLARGVSSTAHIGHGRIVPKLSPKSDSHFFGHDYPDDFKPKSPLEKDFDHPYPVVQESDVYDKDFVKDENSDDGEWRAQMTYDRIRTKLEKLRADEGKIVRKKEEMEDKLAAERAKKKELDEKRKKAEEKLSKKESEAKAQEDEAAKGQVRPARANATEREEAKADEALGEVVNVSTKVEKELVDIEDCKEQLDKAREKLKKLHEEVKNANSNTRKAQQTKEGAEEEAAALRAKELEAEAAVKEAEAKHDSALKASKSKNEDLRDVEKRLEKAEARLRKLRRETDRDGGVYPTARSEATRGARVALPALALLAAWCASL